jgi:hypothetical protein
MIFDWINRYRVRDIDSDTALYGLILLVVLMAVVIVVKWVMRDQQKY